MQGLSSAVPCGFYLRNENVSSMSSIYSPAQQGEGQPPPPSLAWATQDMHHFSSHLSAKPNHTITRSCREARTRDRWQGGKIISEDMRGGGGMGRTVSREKAKHLDLRETGIVVGNATRTEKNLNITSQWNWLKFTGHSFHLALSEPCPSEEPKHLLW